MESMDFTNEELTAQLAYARKMATLAETAGEADAENMYRSSERALLLEAKNRRLDID